MATRSHTHTRPLTADALATTLRGLLDRDEPPEPMVIGVEPCVGGIDLHLAPVPFDDRVAAAGLFCMRAEPSWCAVATTGSGRARHLDDGHVLGSIRSLVVVDRDGGIASRMRFEPLDDHDPLERFHEATTPRFGAISSSDDPGPVVGLTVDALHRMLDLPSPGDPPPTPLMALAVWSQDLIERLLDGQHLDWPDAVALHPGAPSGGAVETSVETVVEATLRTQGSISWERLHRRAQDGHARLDLSPQEIAWMDPVLYARWVVDSLPDADLAADLLRAHSACRTADLVTAVARQVTAALESVNRG